MEPVALIPLSALQHWLYCPRQCALIHLEREWVENRYTAEGRVVHEAAHSGRTDSRKSVRLTRGMPVVSDSAGLTGQCDVVELHFSSECSKNESRPVEIVPVEYKRGRPKSHRADEVQLCAQAICLEDMFGLPIGAGFLFYGRTQRRLEVAFDQNLRHLVLEVTQAIRSCLESGKTPAPEYDQAKCDRCSMFDICQPLAVRFKRGTGHWFERRVRVNNSYA